MIDLKLKGKNVVVTGGTHGIGKSIACAFANEECNIAVFSRTKERVEEMSSILKSRNISYICSQADVFNEKDVKNFMDDVDKKWGQIDILINNIGGGGRWGKDIVEETDDKVWDEVYYKNSVVAYRFTKWAIPYMRKNKWGRVVSIASVLGKEAGGRPWFNMAKASQISLMKTLSKVKYLARDGITFNTVSPGPIFIEDTGWGLDEKQEDIPIGRLGTVDEVSFVVLFICSPFNSFMNGSCITIDGGISYSF